MGRSATAEADEGRLDEMKVFVAGASGTIGRRLLPMLVGAGHDVVGSTRSPEKTAELAELGAEPVVMDALDARAVLAAVRAAEPDVIVHQLTALQGVTNLRRFDEAFALTNRLRREGLDHLLGAARAVGARRLVAQSYTGWPNERTGGPVKTEEDALDPTPLPSMTKTLVAIRYLEETLSSSEEVEGVALRYGGFYGYGTSLGEGGEHMKLFLKRRFPIIGDGSGIWSFTHIDDAASATVAALNHGRPGVYNVVDDEPAPVSEWLPYLARVLGTKPPWRLPVWLGRLVAGEAIVLMMTDSRGSSNAKAKRELSWRPRYSSWRDGFRGGLTNPDGAVPLHASRPRAA
jgi:nucleoside-diphosphate-sugar epimerase